MFQKFLSRLDTPNRDDIVDIDADNVIEIYSRERTPKEREEILLEGLPRPDDVNSSPKSTPPQSTEEDEGGENVDENGIIDQYQSRVSQVFSFLFRRNEDGSNSPTKSLFGETTSNLENSTSDDSLGSEVEGVTNENHSPTSSSPSNPSLSSSTMSINSNSSNPVESPVESSTDSLEDLKKLEEETQEKEKEWTEEKDFLESKIEKLITHQRQTMKKLIQLKKQNELLQDKLREKHLDAIKWKRRKFKSDEEITKLKKRVEELEFPELSGENSEEENVEENQNGSGENQEETTDVEEGKKENGEST